MLAVNISLQHDKGPADGVGRVAMTQTTNIKKVKREETC